VAVLIALVAAFLPARYWASLSALPIRRYATLSALLTLSGGFALGIGGFMAYSTRVMQAAGKLQIEVAERQLRGDLPETAVVASGPMAAAMLSPLAFVFLTPVGLVSTYLVLTGLIRALTCVVDDPMGDPVVTLADGVVRRVSRRARSGVQRRRRERAEGPEVPDRLYTGEWAGLKNVDLIVVSSRRKSDWEPGTVVLTRNKWYVIGVPFERHMRDGLRTLYPLSEQKTGEVLRKGVSYELPPLQQRRSRDLGGR